MELLREFLGFPMLISAGWLLLVYIELEGNESILQIFFILTLVSLFFWHKKHFPKQYKTGFNILNQINVVRLFLIITIAITAHSVFNAHSKKSFDTLSDRNEKDEVISIYDNYVSTAKKLMIAKNHDYGEAWREMRTSSLTDLILQKIYRNQSTYNF